MQDQDQGGPSRALRSPGEPADSPEQKQPRDRWRGEAPKPVEPRNPPKQQEGPRATFAAVKPPALNVPKGGGALKGIGETFRTNPVTGTASAQIPLPITQAPRGPTPSLSLSYDSGQGNGVFGLGWDISIPQIVRKTDKRLPEYVDSEESDVFLFAGDDLVPRCNLVSNNWVRDTGTATEGADNYDILRFRSRVEGAFSKIERWTHQTNRIAHWRVTSRDNTTSKYGDSTNSRIADPANDKRIYAWLLSETKDDRGHVVTYTYKGEDNAGVSYAKPSEAHRKGVTALPNRYLKRVTYCNTTVGNGSTYKFELVFDYGEHDANSPGPNDSGSWTVRQDAFSTCRAGFELRTYRLCRRVLMFHNFSEIHASRTLVRSLDLTYSESAKVTQLASAKVVGYTWNGSSYDRSELPPVSFGYSAAPFTKKIDALSANEARDFNPASLGKAAQWVDLDGEGLPGVLTDRGGAITFKLNLGEGHLGPARKLASAPNLSMQGGGAQLTDVAGSGTMSMVRLDPRASGYYERTTDGWGPFRTFASNPNVNWSDPNLKMADLNGDGFDDILIARGDHFVWYPSLGRDGYGPARRVPLPRDPASGPAVIFASRENSVFLADMSGDGQTDIVQVTHSRVCYWPGLGHGRFGARVVMGNCPKIDRPDRFHASRVRLADLDGTGTADLLYFDGTGVTIWPNLSGNAFALEPHKNECVPVPDALRTLSIVDLHGTGMSTLVWSPTRQPTVPLRHTSPFGTKKPYLLESIDNGMGLQVAFHYAPSTKFYLADKKAGKPWATKLPFPVQTVEKMESYDAVSRTRLATSYTYHHGHYDSVEREFRGFGRVDEIDAETFDTETGKTSFPDVPIDNVNGQNELAQPPVLTKTWFHLGNWRMRDTLSGAPLQSAYAAEYWSGDSAAHAQLSCLVETGLPVEEIAEAHRALKGAMLRQEVYGHTRVSNAWQRDTVPFTVTEQSYQAVRRQPKQPALGASRPAHPAVFQSLPREIRTHTYDRVESDPRVHQWAALGYDATYGDVTHSLAMAYARRGSGHEPEQLVCYAVVTETDIAHATTGGYRLSIPTETRTYELTGYGTTSSPVAYATLVSNYATAASNALVEYHDTPPSGFRRRILERIKIRYYNSASMPTPLAFGTVDPLALVYESYQLDLTDGLLSAVMGTRVTGAMITEGGYVELDTDTYWLPSGRATIAATTFYIPTAFTDPFSKVTSLTYDAYNLLVTEVEDALSNTVAAANDYRFLTPKEVTDPNGNRVQAAFDHLGRVIKVAVMGKSSESLGDTLTNPTEEFTYVTTRWAADQKPNYAKRKVRETHGTSPTPKFQESYVFTDGSGRVALTKTQAEPGDAYELDQNGNVIRDGNGVPIPDHTDTRWVGSGKTVLNNKGNPIKQYEPFFAPTWEFEDDDDLLQWGVTPLVSYDAIGRVTRYANPDETFRTTEYSPWEETAYDENDNESGGDHEDTPSLMYLDPLGRPFLVRADNGLDTQNPPQPIYFFTRTSLDIENQPLIVNDPLERDCQAHKFSIAGRLLFESNIDKGDRYSFADVTGAPIRRWDERNQVFRFEYDELRRPTHLWDKVGAADEILLERRYYGDNPNLTNPQSDNLRGQPILVFDQAGKTKLGPFDFKGNLLTSVRTLAQEYTTNVDWVALATEDVPADAETTAASDLESETFTEERAYDALNRIVSLTTPDDSEFIPTYNEASLLEAVDVKIRGASAATRFVRDIDYDAKGQRTSIQYGNASTKVTTAYTYDELTFRLTHLVTTRASDSKKLQDLSYTHDPVGNITAITDDADDDVFFVNTVVNASQTFSYDPLYRLISATGREHKAQGDVQVGVDGAPLQNLPHTNDSTAVRTYEETYEYDAVGNILEMFHNAGSGAATWTRTYSYGTGTPTNRLVSNSIPGGTATYSHDDHGNITSMPHLSTIDYSPFDQMSHADLGGGGDAYYVYDSSGQRVRKVVDTGANLIKERIYLGGVEIYREIVSSAVDLERETLHVMDGVRRIAMVETKTIENGSTISSPTNLFRVQYTNHLGSAHLECDEEGAVISYEEMHPYGSSAYRSSDSTSEVSARRYRCTGKERDEETGLDYFGARYYAPWLGRWTTADPLGLQAGVNLYLYGRASPVVMVDPNGMDTTYHQPLPEPSPRSVAPFVDALSRIRMGQTAEGTPMPAPPGPSEPDLPTKAPPSAGAGGYTSGEDIYEEATSEDFVPGVSGPQSAGMMVPLVVVSAAGAAPALIVSSILTATTVRSEEDLVFAVPGQVGAAGAFAAEAKVAGAVGFESVVDDAFRGLTVDDLAEVPRLGTQAPQPSTFFRGMTYGEALEVVDAQGLSAQRILANQTLNPGAAGSGAYLTTQEATATHYAELSGLQGRGLGPAVVRMEVDPEGFGRFAASRGISVETPIPRGPAPGATETLIPQEYIEEFNKLAKFFLHE